MGIYIISIIFIIIFCFTDFSKPSQRVFILYTIGGIFILFIGLRGESGADSLNYINFFKYQTDTISDWQNVDKGYAEYGFYYLSVILKSIYNNINFYFLCISALTVPFLLKSLNKYCIYPILGFCVYYSRFLLLRDMNQIRQALAIVIIIYALFFLLNNNKKKYILYICIATLFHYSSIICLPFIAIYKKKFSLKETIAIILFCSIAGFIGGILLKKILMSTGNVMLVTYINTQNLGLTNPLLYFQILLCLLYTFYKPLIEKEQKGYNIIKNAYLFSIVLLLLTTGLGEIGGRLATTFATCEIFIIPSLTIIVKPRYIGYSMGILLCIILFFLNYIKLLEVKESWIYFS